MKVRRKHTEGYLATTALIGFLVAFGYNGEISYKAFFRRFSTNSSYNWLRCDFRIDLLNEYAKEN